MPLTALNQRPVSSQLREARRQLMSRGSLPPDLLQPELASSWLRSWDAGLQPSGRTVGAPHASGAQLARALDLRGELVAHARPVMEFVFEQTRGSDSMVIQAGAEGLLLESLGDPQFANRAERVALRPGATWHEQYRGTNAVGTALTDGRAVEVRGDEHYLERNGFLTCAAVPIHDPDGSVLGALDVSGDHRGYHRHTLGLVRTAARMIEHRLFDTRYDLRRWAGLRLRFHAQPEGIGTVAEGLLAVSEDGFLRGANSTALDLLGLRWQDLAQTRLDAVLTEPLAQLLESCHRLPGGVRAVRTVCGQSLWLRGETGRVLSAGRSERLLAPVMPVLATPSPSPSPSPSPGDALAALDTGDAVLRHVIARARKVMAKPIPLLLIGESGVGKELLARAVHDSGPRRLQAFVAVNCAALPENLIEAELFGYEGGAYTGARREGAPGRIREAHGGTLFLDEIGDMPLLLQARLLRVLQDRQVVPLGGGKAVAVDFSLMCATHRQLPDEMQAGRFREDLYYRLNGLTLQLPALRKRSDFEHLLCCELKALLPGREVSVSPELMGRLRRYRWPGNMRQLANTLRTACALLDEDESVIGAEHLPDDLVQALQAGDAAEVVQVVEMAQMTSIADDEPGDLRSLSRQAIARTISACGGNLSEAARSLGISRNTLYRRMRG